MNPDSNDPPQPTPSQNPQPILDYHSPDKVEARWGMPYWGQAAFGGIYLFAATALSLVMVAFVGPLASIFAILFLFFIFHVHQNWKWRGFTAGILLAIGLSILAFGICAVVLK